MSVEIVASERGLVVRVYSGDYFNTYESDYISWEEVAKHIAPYLAKEKHRNDDAE